MMVMMVMVMMVMVMMGVTSCRVGNNNKYLLQDDGSLDLRQAERDTPRTDSTRPSCMQPYLVVTHRQVRPGLQGRSMAIPLRLSACAAMLCCACAVQ